MLQKKSYNNLTFVCFSKNLLCSFTIFYKIYFLVYGSLSYHRSSQLIIYLFHNFFTQTENVQLKIYKAEQTQEEMFLKSSSESFCFCFNLRKYKEFFAIKFSTNSRNGNGLKQGKINSNEKVYFTLPFSFHFLCF